jgi:heme exporter protein A
MLTLNLRPSEGSFTIEGYDPAKQDLEIRQRIGVISHQSFLYDDLTARQNLEFFGRLYGVADATARAEELLRNVGLSTRADDPVRTFSRGMQQRVSLARALVHDPRIVLLDEPFTGLDPHAARTLRSMLDSLREKGRTVFLVTHNLSRGLELTDRWMVLSRGRVVEEGPSADTDPAAFESSYFEHFEPRTAAGAAR